MERSLALLLLFSSLEAAGDPPCDAGCERRRAEALLVARDTRSAVETLKGAVARHPADAVLPLLLARAYLLERNPFWAEATLAAALSRRPEDAAARSWLALVHLREGDLDLAEQVLAAGREPPEGPERTRRALLSAYRSALGNEPAQARKLLSSLGRSSWAFPEDRPVRGLLERRVDPFWVEPVSGLLEVAAGGTTNALAGSPTDPGVSGTRSGLLDGTLQLRLAPRVSPSVRPVLELEADGHLLLEDAYRELSSLETSLRLGVQAILGGRRVLAAYRADALDLDQTPARFSEAHRAELELERASGLLVFGGAGHRVYRDDRRTRTEWDLGGGGPLRFLPQGVLGATFRGASARSPAYDLLGASVAAAVRLRLCARLSLRLALTGSWDDYPHSGGLEGLLVFGTSEKRRDLTGKAAVSIWASSRGGLRAGLEGQLARRDSTADERPGFDFDYTEARVRLLVRIGFGADPSAPRAVVPDGHVPLEWGLGEGDGAEAERIIELLRQDEELRRGSSCGVR